MAQIQERVVLRDLNDPILIMAFASPSKAGATAPWAVSQVANHLGAELVAEFEAGDFYNYSQLRPQIRVDGGQPQLEWPRNAIYQMTTEEGRSVLVFIGVEPH